MYDELPVPKTYICNAFAPSLRPRFIKGVVLEVYTIFTVSPTYKLFVIAAPPATCREPVVNDVEFVAVKTKTEPSCFTLNNGVPPLLSMCQPLVAVAPEPNLKLFQG